MEESNTRFLNKDDKAEIMDKMDIEDIKEKMDTNFRRLVIIMIVLFVLSVIILKVT